LLHSVRRLVLVAYTHHIPSPHPNWVAPFLTYLTISITIIT
jgi:hypothetical protein